MLPQPFAPTPNRLLPVELMTEIFALACDWPHPEEANLDNATPRRTPFSKPNRQLVRLSSVCKSWRSAAIGAPALWKHVDVSRWRANLARLFAERSGHVPLEVISMGLDSVVPFKADLDSFERQGRDARDTLQACLPRAHSFRTKIVRRSDLIDLTALWDLAPSPVLEIVEILSPADNHLESPVEHYMCTAALPALRTLRTDTTFILDRFKTLKELVLVESYEAFRVPLLLHLANYSQHLEVLRIMKASERRPSAGFSARDPIPLPRLRYFEYDVERQRDSVELFYSDAAFQDLMLRLVLSPQRVRLRVLYSVFTLGPSALGTLDVKQLLSSWPAFDGVHCLSVQFSQMVSFVGWATAYPSPDHVDRKFDLSVEFYSVDPYETWGWSGIVHLCQPEILSALQWGYSGCPFVLIIATAEWWNILRPMVALETLDYNGVDLTDLYRALAPDSDGEEEARLICPRLQSVRLISTTRSREVGWSVGVPKDVAECVLARTKRGAPLRRLHVDCSRRTFGPRNAKDLEDVIADVRFGCTVDEPFIRS